MKYTIFFGLLAVMALAACKKYDDYYINYEKTAAYFSSQKPLRKIVAYDNMQFKVGVVLGGVIENQNTYTVNYTVDTALLRTVAGATQFKLLPPDYYTVSNANTMLISPGRVIGDVTVSLNKQAFIADPKAVTNYYALPLRIVSSTTDTVLRGDATTPAKDYTVLVVKYLSPFSGFYYHKGIEQKVDAAGQVISSTIYSNPDLLQNAVWTLNTVKYDTIAALGAGTNTAGILKLAINNANQITVSAGNASIANVSGTGSFDDASKSYYLNYTYSVGVSRYVVKDTLIQRLPPEQDLRFEEW